MNWLIVDAPTPEQFEPVTPPHAVEPKDPVTPPDVADPNEPVTPPDFADPFEPATPPSDVWADPGTPAIENPGDNFGHVTNEVPNRMPPNPELVPQESPYEPATPPDEVWSPPKTPDHGPDYTPPHAETPPDTPPGWDPNETNESGSSGLEDVVAPEMPSPGQADTEAPGSETGPFEGTPEADASAADGFLDIPGVEEALSKEMGLTFPSNEPKFNLDNHPGFDGAHDGLASGQEPPMKLHEAHEVHAPEAPQVQAPEALQVQGPETTKLTGADDSGPYTGPHDAYDACYPPAYDGSDDMVAIYSKECNDKEDARKAALDRATWGPGTWTYERACREKGWCPKQPP